MSKDNKKHVVAIFKTDLFVNKLIHQRNLILCSCEGFLWFQLTRFELKCGHVDISISVLISLRKFVPSLEYCKNVNSPSTKYDSLF
jgi:hypothetical protein